MHPGIRRPLGWQTTSIVVFAIYLLVSTDSGFSPSVTFASDDEFQSEEAAAVGVLKKIRARLQFDRAGYVYSVMTLAKTDDVLHSLGELKNVRQMNLTEVPRQSPDLAALRHLKTLQYLRIGAYRVENLDLTWLTSLSDLKVLWITGSVTDSDLTVITSLTKLRALHLTGTEITADGILQLKNSKSLIKLNLGINKLGNDALKNVCTLTRLTTLSMSSTRITDEGLEHLSSLPSLRSLNLGSTKITDRGLVTIGKLKNLWVLELARTPITSAGLLYLDGLDELYFINLGHRHPDFESGIDALQLRMPKVSVNWIPDEKSECDKEIKSFK